MEMILRSKRSGNLHQFGHAGHRAVLVHDFHQHPAGSNRQTGNVNRGFGMARTAQYPTPFGTQRENMAGFGKILVSGQGIDQRLDGLGTVVGRDARGTAIPDEVNGNRKGRGVQGIVIGNHELQAQLVAPVLDEGAQMSPRPWVEP